MPAFRDSGVLALHDAFGARGDPVERIANDVKIFAPGIGDHQPLALTIEKLDAKCCLQQFDLMADGALGDTQLFRRPLFPEMWMGLFSNDEQVVRLGTSAIYGFYGLGSALFFVTQGVGSNMWTTIANALRLVVSAAGALIAIYRLDLGQVGFLVAVAGGFCAYAALATGATLRVKEPAATQ